MDTLEAAFGAIQSTVAAQALELAEARALAAAATEELDALRAASSAREAALLAANTRLLAHVDELSAAVTRLQTEATERARADNNTAVTAITAAVAASSSPRSSFHSSAAHLLGGPSSKVLSQAVPPEVPASAFRPSQAPVPLGSAIHSEAAALRHHDATDPSVVRSAAAASSPAKMFAAIDSALATVRAAGRADVAATSARLRGAAAAGPDGLHRVSGESRLSVSPPLPPHELPPWAARSTPMRYSSLAGERTSKLVSAAGAASAPDTARLRISLVGPVLPPTPQRAQTVSSSATAYAASASPSVSAAAAQGGRVTAHATQATGGGGAAASIAQKGKHHSGSAPATAPVPPGRAAAAPASRPEVRAAPYEEDGGGSGSGQISGPAHAAVATSQSSFPRMGVADFFALLRRHVPAPRLQSLLGSLADFNAGKLTAPALMEAATSALRPPTDELRAARMHPASTDLVAAFQAYMVLA